MNDNSVVANSFIVSLGNTLSKLLGLIREMVIAAFYGASALVDAYLVALTIPMALFNTVNQALSITILPLITEYDQKEGRESVLAMLNTITSFLMICILLLVLLGTICASPLISLISPGFNIETTIIAEKLTRIVMPVMIFMGLTGLATGILQSQKRFLYPALMGVACNITIIIAVCLSANTFGIYGLAFATVLGTLVQWLIQVPDLRKVGFKYRFQLLVQHPGFRKLGLLIVPVLIGAGASQINLLVDRMMASTLVEGSIAALGYASKLYTFISAVLTVAVASAVFPDLAQNAIKNNLQQFLIIVNRSIKVLLLIVIPAAVGIIILRVPIVKLIFERGAFDETASILTVTALMFYAIGIPALALQDVILRAFYALQDTKTPMYIGLVTMVLNIILILLLIKPMELGGLALATSLSISVGAVLLLVCLRNKLGPIGGKDILITGIKVIIASILMGIAVWLIYNIIQSMQPKGTVGNLVTVLINVILGIAIYYLIIRLMNINEVKWVEEWMKQKSKFFKD